MTEDWHWQKSPHQMLEEKNDEIERLQAEGATRADKLRGAIESLDELIALEEKRIELLRKLRKGLTQLMEKDQ